MAGQVLWENNYIIQVDDTPIKVKVPKTSFHQLLKGGRGVGQSERHSVTPIKFQWHQCKCSQWLALLITLDLPIPRLQVKWGEPLGPLQALMGLIDPGKQVCILYCLTVHFPEVNTESQAPILLPDQNHCTSPWTVQFPDGPNIQHLLEVDLHIIIYMGDIHQWHSLKGIWLVNSIRCLMRDVFARSKLLWTNRYSHLTSSFLACLCSSMGYSSRPQRFSSSRIQSFQDLWVGLSKVPVGRTTGGTLLAGVTLLTTTLVESTVKVQNG